MLASQWPKLMQKWQLMETELSKLCDRKQKLACIQKIRFVTTAVLIIALSIISNNNFRKYPELCMNVFHCIYGPTSFQLNVYYMIGHPFILL